MSESALQQVSLAPRWHGCYHAEKEPHECDTDTWRGPHGNECPLVCQDLLLRLSKVPQQQPEALIVAVFPDGATDQQVLPLRLVANEMINAGELLRISGEGYYLVPSA